MSGLPTVSISVMDTVCVVALTIISVAALVALKMEVAPASVSAVYTPALAVLATAFKGGR